MSQVFFSLSFGKSIQLLHHGTETLVLMGSENNLPLKTLQNSQQNSVRESLF